jgi:hypothetical protein
MDQTESPRRVSLNTVLVGFIVAKSGSALAIREYLEFLKTPEAEEPRPCYDPFVRPAPRSPCSNCLW